jgi:hypothetical protein
MTTIQIDVKNGEVTCGSNGGHLRVPHGTVINWTSTGADKKFVLKFEQIGFEAGGAAGDLEHWPFVDPSGPQSEPKNTFKGTLRKLASEGHTPVYKYSVRVGDLLLDPIIIVDR